jgi:hypothetical protein
MKKIEKDNGQIFEIIESKKELKSFLIDTLSPFDKIWNDDDSSLSFYDVDGNCHSFAMGDKLEKINTSKIESLIEINDSTIVIYGNVEIVYNEHYEDW